MTKEEFDKLPFAFVSHLALSDCYISLYENKRYGIIWQKSTKEKGFFDFGTTEKFYYKDKWYSKKKFINEIIKDIEL